MNWIRELVDPQARHWEELYRNRWQHDHIVRSTHGNNCTGGCSWEVFVKEGIVTWEMQAVDYPRLKGVPPYEPRGCQRGISYSWYIYSPLRVKYPYIRGTLLDLWRKVRKEKVDPVDAWEALVSDEEKRRSYQQARGKGGLRRAEWDEVLEIVAASLLYTAKKYGPDRVVGFSPIPAMSMASYAAGSRFLQLFGGFVLSFYDLYCDFPPASPETWGEKTDVSESADWYNSKFIAVMGSNLNMTRTPDAHFAVEARGHGARLVVFSPDFSQVSKHADWWLPVHAGMDGAFWMAVNHVILNEFHAERQVPFFTDYLKRYADAPFLVELEKTADGWRPGGFVRAGRLNRYVGEQHAEWKLLVWDQLSDDARMPQGSIGFRWQEKKGLWNLRLRDGEDGTEIDPRLTFAGAHDDEIPVVFDDFGNDIVVTRGVPVKKLKNPDGTMYVATVFDLLMAQFGVGRGFSGDYPASYDDCEAPYTPAWQERFTGVARENVIRFARDWAGTAEHTEGRCTIIIGSGINHWYHNNLIYRAGITALILCGCVGRNGGGLNHYTGQEKVAPEASWSHLAMAKDWVTPSRLQNGPSFHYMHSDQWRYDGKPTGRYAENGHFARKHTADFQLDAVRRGWLPFYPQFDRNPAGIVKEAEAEGARSAEEIVRHVVRGLKEKTLRFAAEDPDAPENWPRVWLIWRGNAILASAKGHEYFLKHYLGTHSNAIAQEVAVGEVNEVLWHEKAPEGKMDLVVDLNFRMDSSALYSDIILPSAGWYEKDDLNTTDLHSFVHPLGKAVPPCWESKNDWEIFTLLAEKVSSLSNSHFPRPFREVVATPLTHDSPDELAQPRVQNWWDGECEAVPGRTMPHVTVVERDYPNLHRRFISLGPETAALKAKGMEMEVADLYEEFLLDGPTEEWGGRRYPSLAKPISALEMILAFAPETNGEIAYRGFRNLEEQTGVPLADLAERHRDVRYDFEAVICQPRRILTSPCWTGVTNNGRPYAAYCINVERGLPWRTLSGRQHLYLDHEGYRAVGEHLPVFKPKLTPEETYSLSASGEAGILLNCLTPHSKWGIHTTYADSVRMLTLSRGIRPCWLSEGDARLLRVTDNDWVEVDNDNGAVVTRAVVSTRIPEGICFYYHAPERTVSVPRSPSRGNRRAGGHNSLTKMRLKPVLMVGGYAQHCYLFNEYGPPASDRDTWVRVRRLEGPPQW